MKIIKLVVVALSFFALFSCKKNELPTPFDHAGQAIVDDAILKTFLETHYYTPPVANAHFGRVDTIQNGETSLLSQVTAEDVTLGDISYKVYFLKVIPEGVGESPSKVDSVLVNYKGLLLTKVNDVEEDRTIFDSNENYTFWANLYGGVIPGWSLTLTNFKSGVNTSVPDAPLSFAQTGKGIIFMPSGLAYRNASTVIIPANSPLMFHIEAAMVKRTDQDLDGLFSIYEDTDNDGTMANDDTDGDGKANFIDFDDDNDGISTKYESADVNNDGNPADAIDTDNDGTPNYLDDDDDGDGILTKNENADPNGDGNPDDAEDSDGDNTPDYLDNN